MLDHGPKNEEMKNRRPPGDDGSTGTGLVEVKGLEPSASTLRSELRHLPGLGFLVDSRATSVDEVHRGARKGAVGQQLSPEHASGTVDVAREIRATAIDWDGWHERAV